jgi:hypothetical protein
MDSQPREITEDEIVNNWKLTDELIQRIDPKTGRTVLHHYCNLVNIIPIKIFQYLIDIKLCGFINTQDELGCTPFHYAIQEFNPTYGGSINTLLYLLKQDSIDINCTNFCGRSLLHLACQYLNTLTLDVFKLLIEIKGFDINLRDERNNTPLHLALEGFDPIGGDVVTLKYLIGQENADFNIKNGVGMSVLQLAVIGKDMDESFQYVIVEEVIGGYLEQ